MSHGRAAPRPARAQPDGRRLLGAALGAGLIARALGAAAATRPPGGALRWRRVNHRGEQVTLLAGPVVTASSAAAVAVVPGLPPSLRGAAVGVVAAAGLAGAHDDLSGTGEDRGLRGHLAAAREGRVTSGLLKVAVIGAAGLAAGVVLRCGLLDRLLAGVVVAGSANLVNLLDLRPGRAIKSAVVVAAPGLTWRAATGGPTAPDLVTAAALGAGLAVLADDLAERTMLGDAGANALGAALGVAAAARASRGGLALRAAALLALTLVSERVSFTAVVARVPPLRALDEWGRRPAVPAASPA